MTVLSLVKKDANHWRETNQSPRLYTQTHKNKGERNEDTIVLRESLRWCLLGDLPGMSCGRPGASIILARAAQDDMEQQTRKGKESNSDEKLLDIRSIYCPLYVYVNPSTLVRPKRNQFVNGSSSRVEKRPPAKLQIKLFRVSWKL